MDEARNEYEEALKTYRGLAQKDPNTYLPDVAMTLNNLGILDRDRNRMAEARKEYEEALKIYEAFVEQDPEQFTTDVKRLKKLLKEFRSKLSLSARSSTHAGFGLDFSRANPSLIDAMCGCFRRATRKDVLARFFSVHGTRPGKSLFSQKGS
jgi:tetratricopeptide (TPR) repeat protein